MNRLIIKRENGRTIRKVTSWNSFYKITILVPIKFTIWNQIKTKIRK